MKIHLGVNDVPYANNPNGATTAKVAEWLEEKYGILGAFVARKETQIVSHLESGLQNSLEEMLIGLPVRDPLGTASSLITRDMREWISLQEVERVGIPGVPTRAALLGLSSRFKSGLNGVSMAAFKKGVRTGRRRPSFRDTGLMERNYRCWSEV